MSSGDGIIPDQSIPSNIKFECYDYWYYIDFYLLHKMKAAKSAALEKGQLSKEDYNQFVLEYFDDESSVSKSAGCNDNLEEELWNSYQKMQLNDLAYIQFLNVNDAYVRKAMNFMQDERPTLAYLSEEK